MRASICEATPLKEAVRVFLCKGTCPVEIAYEESPFPQVKCLNAT